MEIMQQKQIKAYLVREFIDEKGTKLFINQKNTEYAYNMLIESTHKTENQMNALITTILPCVALYKTLLKADLSNQAMLKAWH